ncbi:MAG TPA: DUF4352 domain-containing protein [Thermomicrobiales bacterium]|nr:DUF4352 domain-containing protein [Thermomicrobiales bacterium]
MPNHRAKTPLYKRWWVWLVSIIAVVMIIGFAGGLGDTSTEPGTAATVDTPVAPDAEQPEPAEGASEGRPGIGESASWSGFGSGGTVTLNSVRRIASPESPTGTSPDNGSYLVADVTVEAGDGTVSGDPFFWVVRSEDGTTYPADITALAVQIDSAQIAAGRQIRGEVAFDAPEGALLLDYRSPGGESLATFSIEG